MRFFFGLHRRHRLILLWALGYHIQERYEQYSDWVDCVHESRYHFGDFWGSPPWDDVDCKLRLKPHSGPAVRRHVHFYLIILWTLGFAIQEKSLRLTDWIDSGEYPSWSDTFEVTKFRLKCFRKSSGHYL
jgi:hypothetical protein